MSVLAIAICSSLTVASFEPYDLVHVANGSV